MATPEKESENFKTLKRVRASHMAQLTRIYKELETYMMSKENKENVDVLYRKLCDRFTQFRTAHLNCLDMCTDVSVLSDLEDSFKSCKDNFVEFKERFAQWSCEIQQPEVDDGEVSVVSNRTCSSQSSVSSRAELRKAKAKRLVAEQKLRQLKRQVELQRSKKELEIQQQLLEQESEIELARIEESSWKEAVAEEDGVVTDVVLEGEGISREIPPTTTTTTTTTTAERDSGVEEVEFCSDKRVQDCTKVTGRKDNNSGNNNTTSGFENTLQQTRSCQSGIESTRNVGKSDFVSLSALNADNGIDTAFQRLAMTLHEGFSLPKPEILTFSGEPTDYCKFVKNFETNIESRIVDANLRLSYLIQYCTGEAKSAIEDCVLLEPEEGYKRARSILLSRYGRHHVIARTYVDRLVHGPQIKGSDTKALLQLALDMQKCEITLSQLNFASDIDNSENLRSIVKRLPMHLRVKWVDIAHAVNESGREPKFGDLAKFIDEKARVANSLYAVDLIREEKPSKHEHKSAHKGQVKGKGNVYNTQGAGAIGGFKRKCLCCSGTCYSLSECVQFKAMKLNERTKFLRSMKLCFNCFKGKHFSKNCTLPSACTVSGCSLKHHLLLHSWVRPGSNDTATQSSVNCASVDGKIIKNCLGIIPVIVSGENGTSCKTYALLDDGADKTLCDERLIQRLNVKTKSKSFKLSTLSSTGNTIEGQEVDIYVQPLFGEDKVKLHKVWTVSELPISHRSAPVRSEICKLAYLSDIQIHDIETKDVMLLIGTDSPDSHVPLEVRCGNSDQPYAVRTRLGWAIRGPVRVTKETEEVNIHFEQTHDITLHRQLERMWNTDFNDVVNNDKLSYSVEDKRALRMMDESIKHENGHYTLSLPWRDETQSLPNDIALAHARLKQLKRKLSSDSKLHEMYTVAVNDYIEKGYAREVKDIESVSKRVWYLPHHPVSNVNKPGKVRVVFDCAATYQGVSLNSQLLRGPDLMNNLFGVVVRFRQEPIAIAADIEAMFHQVRVSEKDCDALRFLWWPGGDLNQEPRVYSMRVHLFGATSSPSCTTYALKKTAADNADNFKPDVLSTVDRNFYVDDCLKSVDSVKKAITLAADLRTLLQRGGFRLTKWLSNSKEVLYSIPESERAPSVVSLNPDDELPSERALGINWDVQEDKIIFKVKIPVKPMTRRGMVATVSSIFDPLGLVAPVTLKAKAIIQCLCKERLSWDDPISQNHQNEWMNWLEALPNLEALAIDRCYKSRGFGKLVNTQLHLFSDGSELGYGACAYLRLTDDQGKVSCSLVAGKSRLAPLKKTTIPRLELSAAVVACRLFSSLSQELEIDVDEVIFWTDSMIVLGYIRNESRRFKTFVGNRVSEIQTITSASQWRHVESQANPADIASRGIDAADTESLNKWINGPTFLSEDPRNWSKQPTNFEDLDEDDTEVKGQATLYVVKSEAVNKLFEYFSSWNKLVRSTAWFIRFQTYCRQRYLKQDVEVKTENLTLEETQRASETILQYVQRCSFPDEIASLGKAEFVKRDSCLASFCPVLVKNLLRVKGRTDSNASAERQIILPSRHHVTTLIIRHFHERLGHTGIHQVLAATRKLYWIMKGPSAVKAIIRNCLVCRKNRGPMCQQQMAPLLEEQTTADKPPFTFVGVDYFGPIIVKQGRSTVKRYGCLFTCLTTRAVHLETAHSLTTDSFIAAFQRFTSRRGTPAKVYSDNGTNLVGGQKELRKSIREWNKSKIGQYMTINEIEWHFNPPYASHMGGVWERMIRSTRTILKALTREQLLTDEQLTTLLTEVEKILNDRPITPVSNDPNDPPALTPSMLLLMKSNSSLPLGNFTRDDLYSRRWWRQVQYLANVFWRRWTKEYLPTLQARQKWLRPRVNLKVDDVVLVSDERTERGKWPLGRIVKVTPGRDGYVRSCVIRSGGSECIRPVHKLCLLESSLQ